jgi:hypothetical protein
MCLFFLLLLIGPRVAGIFWWLVDQARWASTFESVLIAILGIIFVPWTTIMYVIVFPGGVEGFDWFWLGLGLVADVALWAGGGLQGRKRYMGEPTPPPA